MAKDLLLEIGTEELPAAFLPPALQDLVARTREALEGARLGHGEIVPYGTPRRLAVIVHDVAVAQEDVSQVVSGPPQRAAYDAEGRPTKAAEGFARGQGVEVSDLIVIETPKGAYVAAKVEEKGRPAEEILPPLLQKVVAGMPFRKSMRWGEVDVTFARPIHWMVALLGGKALTFSYGDVESGNRTRGHRFLAPKPFALRSPGQYLARLEEAHVQPDVAARRARIQSETEAVVSAADPAWRLRPDEALLDEVTHLVEYPVAVLGRFDEDFLALPAEVLVSEMRHHQRYFSVVGPDGLLVPAFVAISNTPVQDPEVSRRGYERVLAARLSDARYFFDTDRKLPLESRVDALGRVVFQQKLGSILEKVERVRALSLWLASQLDLEAKHATIGRTASLAKADLTTGMVGEFPELQGTMGRYYAAADGEPEVVSLGIEEHYLPRHAGDRLPDTDEGALVGIADRLDTLAGIIGIGKQATGGADPFGLRRACLAIVNITLGKGYRYSLDAVLGQVLRLLAPKLTLSPEETRERVLDFFRGRLKNLWTTEGHAPDVVEAVLAAGFEDLASARERVRALGEIKQLPEFVPLAVAFTRAANIVSKAPNIDAKEINAELFEDEVERVLWKASLAVREKVDRALAEHDYQSALQAMVALKEPVDAFFEKVLVMAEDARVRDNRLLLLSGVSDLFSRIADFSRIQTES